MKLNNLTKVADKRKIYFCVLVPDVEVSFTASVLFSVVYPDLIANMIRTVPLLKVFTNGGL